MKNKERGFTLFEVLISLFITAISVLGLVMLELNILRSSQSSFNYTIASIEANTLIDKVWRNLCAIEMGASYSDLHTEWQSALKETGLSGSASTDFLLEDSVTVSWTDKNFLANQASDQVTLNVTYPNFKTACK